MKKIAVTIIIVFSLCFYNIKAYAQLHKTPACGQNFNLKWSTSMVSDDYFWPSGQLENTYTNVDGSGTDITIKFTGETSTLGFWAGQTPKVGTQSSYLYKAIDLLSNGFSGSGITCTIIFSKPIYAFSFDIHHVNVWEANGDKYEFTGKDQDGNIIYPEFTNSSKPTYTSNNNTGIVNATSNITSGENAIVGVNYASPNYIKSVSFTWGNCDNCSTNVPHATGIGDFSFCTPQNLDFDGIDDYVNRSAFLGGKSEVTMMSWIKLDSNSSGGEIIGQRNFRLYLDNNKQLKAFIKTNSGEELSSVDLPEGILKENLWYHTIIKFDGDSGTATLYLNGNVIWSYQDDSLIGTIINDTPDWNSDYDFEIGRNTEFDNNHFKGSIYECRVYDKALSLNQIHQQINQEIENNNGNIRGTVIPKDIDGLLWSNLILYYKMSVLNTGFTPDSSNSKEDGNLNNMSIFQENQDYTAPLPYVTTSTSTGNWSNPNNWLQSNEWVISTEIPEHSIIHIKGDLEIDTNISTTGLIIDDGSSLSVQKNSGLFNSWYLKLDGILDLEEESQLIQTENSTLDITSSGILEKDLQGTADKYTYNYWASPVGKVNQTTNNNNYALKDVFTNITFLETGHDGAINPISIADYWIWKYINKPGDNFASWQQVRSTGDISPGEGFTMKGPGTGSIDEEQNYVLQGKPNNENITLNVNAGNDYLVGNPYPSAMDAVKFINDNKSTISGVGSSNGTLYFWKHWGGGSHIANDYQGGYATFSLSGGVPAASKKTEDIINSTGGTPTDVPNRYIPVGQGFYITAETDGIVNFNNSQRIFHIEDSETSTFKNEALKSSDTRMKLRIGFNSINNLQRQLLITVDENATPEYDWGYDSKYIDTQIDDMYWLINNEKFIIQGTNEVNDQTTMPLGIHTKTDGFNTITIDELENTPNDIEIFLHDKELNLYHDLKQSKYEVYLSAGQYPNRFEITFSQDITLSTAENKNKQIEIYFSNEKNKIIIDNPASRLVESVEMFNILGQTLFKFQTNTNKNHIEYNSSQIKAGNYILKIKTEFGMISKKVLIN
ncbi:LamG-like jellyroll fold domain-containing protein [Algibacter aquimarinus]|uniref:Secretion system C-terminal sorting domain-containing protein n=1 Tax=Algibacter aquimarinus TaxID=1136748 RepID=A0ABP9HSA1_9FLAO